MIDNSIKYFNDKGEVAVLYSPGYGSGWSSMNSSPECLFHKDIVKLVLEDKRDEITQELCESLFGEYFFASARTLRVVFLKPGTKFVINEYDGAESITILEKIQYHTA